MKIEWVIAITFEAIGFTTVMTIVMLYGNPTESSYRILGLMGLIWILAGGVIALINSWGG